MTFLDGGNASSTFDPANLEVIDITRDVQFYLQDSPEVQSMVRAPYIGKDSAWVNGWIFDSELSVRQENTQRCAIVVRYGGGWAVPDDSSTASFPSVVIDIWADPTRAEDESPIYNDAKTKCWAIHAAVKRALHLTLHESNNGSDTIYFNTTRVASSEILSEPDLQPVTGGNGAMMLRTRYGITTY